LGVEGGGLCCKGQTGADGQVFWIGAAATLHEQTLNKDLKIQIGSKWNDEIVGGG